MVLYWYDVEEERRCTAAVVVVRHVKRDSR